MGRKEVIVDTRVNVWGQMSTTNFDFQVCAITCYDEGTLKLHLDGAKHKKKLEAPPSSAKCCDICEVKCPNEEAFKLHVEGAKHKKKLEAPPSSAKFCDVCEVNCPNEESFKLHVDGAKHKKKCEAPKIAKFCEV